ncbi:MAG TPA: VWA domain-containing protein [Bryobacteraceae bacterium]|jgi:VWFA-related protein|nr:VWA domain-containing protein [Bryobacteraceae bacterium]
MKLRLLAAGTVLLLGAGASFGFFRQDTPQPQSSDSVAKPRPKETTPPPDQAPIPSEFKKPKDLPPADSPTFRSNATTVTVDVAVLDDKNRFIPQLSQDKFRVFEDGVPQQVTQFGISEAPMTICMLIEFSGRFQAYWTRGWAETLQASYGFLETLKPDDNVAVVEYDMHPTILSDFSPDKRKAEQALNMLRIPGMSESNLFDALTDMADRMSAIEGRKAIILLATGLDTFSKITFDQARRRLQESGVPIYTISILQAARIMAEANGMSPIAEMDFLQADNEMRTFSKETGGQSFFPRFLAEYGAIYNQIEEALRNQYTLAYHPTNVAKDGKFRRIKVQLVNPETNESLRIVTPKGKPIKYQIVAKAGYKAPREVD